MRGRKPKPAALKRLAGNPGRRPLRGVSSHGSPEPPRKLTGREKQIWDRLVKDLGAACVLAKTDSLALARLCEVEALAEQAKDEISRSGIADAEGEKNKFLAVYRDLLNQLIRLYSEFGLTSASRGRVGEPQPSDGGGIDDFLN